MTNDEIAALLAPYANAVDTLIQIRPDPDKPHGDLYYQRHVAWNVKYGREPSHVIELSQRNSKLAKADRDDKA